MIFNSWALSMLPRLGTVRHLRGVYASREEAARHSGGYDTETIARSCLDAARQVRNGEAAWERDSFLLPQVEYSWPVLAEICRLTWQSQGKLTVIDYGGGTGSSYLQYKAFNPASPNLCWIVVEQPSIALPAQAELGSDQLKFVTSLPSPEADRTYVVLLSSVLQYLSDPDQLVADLAALSPASVIIDRTPISDRSFYTVQHVPGSIYSASYVFRVFSEQEFSRLFSRWSQVADFPSYCDSPKKLFRGRIYRSMP